MFPDRVKAVTKPKESEAYAVEADSEPGRDNTRDTPSFGVFTASKKAVTPPPKFRTSSSRLPLVGR